MFMSLSALVPELLELVAFGLGALSLSVAGAYIERFALASAGSGQTALAAWAAVVGAAVLYFAYLLATDKVPAALADLRAATD